MAELGSIIERAEAIQGRLLSWRPVRLRDWSRQCVVPKRGLILSGPRGVGKTTWMLSQAEARHLLYLSADNPVFAGVPLYDLIEAAYLQGYEGVCIDEVHFAADWSQHLKAAYDAFPGKCLIASDSSTIVLKKEIADLSRRFPIQTMPFLSFREYLMLVTDQHIEPIPVFEYPADAVRHLCRTINVQRHFREYLGGGFRPFFIEGRDRYLDRVMQTVQKAMEADIPFLVPMVTENHLRLMQAVIGYLAVSPVPTLQVNSLCREWAIGKEKLYQLLEAMERAHLIRIIRRRNDRHVQSVGAKLLLQEPAMYDYFGSNPGTRREAYVATAFSDAGHRVHAASNESQCDFLVDERTVEVGGRTKSRKAADFVIADDLDLPAGQRLPLWLPGLGY
ncbi:MAG: AAA family ATPase [Oceanipulchritudo sp.]